MHEVFLNKFIQKGECKNFSGSLSKKGYGKIYYKGKSWLAHRLSFVLNKGEIIDNMCVCHKCDNPKCINPDHLWLGSVAQNNADRSKKGRTYKNSFDNLTQDQLRRGEKHGMSKLSEKDVLDIKVSVLGPKKLCEKYGIGTSTVWRIKNNQSWKHIGA